jgi:Spy/CpxP family protein refolding chaperone
MKTRYTILATAAFVATLATGSALAHPGGMGYGMGPGMQHGPGAGMQHGAMGGMGGPATPAAVATQLEQAKAALKISTAQEPAWNKYSEVMTQQAQTRAAMRTQMQARMNEPKPLTAEEMTARHEAMSKLRVDHQAARATAYRDLYAVLTPEQRTIADQQLLAGRGERYGARGGMGHGMGHGMGGGMGHGMGPGMGGGMGPGMGRGHCGV